MTVEICAILTTYQRPELAKRALESILAQTFRPDQIVVVEDGGESWFSEWLAKLNRPDIEYIRHKENRGLAAARNTGLGHARHDFIAYIDDDDCWLPERLEAQVQCWQGLPASSQCKIAAIQVGCEILDERRCHVGSSMPFNQGRLRDSIMEKGASTPSSSFLFVRSALEEIGGFDESLISGIDHDVWMKLAVAGYSSVGIAKPLVIAYKDARHSMMSNTDQRIAGVDQYVRKWAPTYEEWFGVENGRRYAKCYAIRVVSRLAADKLAVGQFRDSLHATRAVLRKAGIVPGLLGFAVVQLMRASTIAILQRVRALVRSVYYKRTEPART